MLKPNPVVLKELKAYSKDLSILWNNGNKWWEIWVNMPWGNRLITPIVKSIYEDGAEMKYAPLDLRIMGWLYSADSQRKSLKKRWKWLAKQKFLDVQDKRSHRSYRDYVNIAKDSYNLVNNEMISRISDSSDFLRPDVEIKKNKIFYRSKKNAKKYFENKGGV